MYYYVKNRTSITNSQIDLISVVKTKTTLFPYYKALYEQLGLYEKYRPQIYKYLNRHGQPRLKRRRRTRGSVSFVYLSPGACRWKTGFAAVDGELGARDVGGLVAGQEQPRFTMSCGSRMRPWG